MKGLILNNFYSVRESIALSLLLAIVSNVVLVLSGNATALKMAFYLPMALITVSAFEVLKQDNLSGWDKFEFILPVERKEIIRSKYITFLLLLIISILVTAGVFMLNSLFVKISGELILISVLRGMGLVLCLASTIYSLTYIFGGDKSELIRIISIIFAFAMFGLVSLMQKMMMGEVEGFDRIFSVNFLLVSCFIFIISYFISISAYKRKEL
ncbi:ABC-2 transporter permease [Bacillus cereus]|uniref:ABC-2 transporter permease n=1 Tax=Bacillus cereus TaxID=1396 RepID=UPI00119F9464|nr:ABC-2 transporter permease [Bacillus cereus]